MKRALHLFVISILFILFLSFSVESASVHRVEAGENLYTIAQNYGVSTKEILGLNHIQNPDKIFKKQVLIIPSAEASHIYRVKKGDTLYKISQKLRIPINILAKINYIQENDILYSRQALYLPYRYTNPLKYRVKAGDTFLKISQEFEVFIDEILFLNNLNINNELKEGQILKIPLARKAEYYDGPNYLSLFPENFFLKGKTNKKIIALTFDDGPDEQYTPQILDVLKKYKVPATFFVMGSRAEKYSEQIKRIVKEGHLLANHTWSHVNLTSVDKERVNKELSSTEDLIAKNVGLKTSLLRPPYGDVSVDLIEHAKKMGYKVIHWSVDSRDWIDMDVEKILINTLPSIKKGAIILFHSAGGKDHSLAATVKVLPELIQTLRMIDYDFVNLDDLLGIQPYK